MLDPARRVDADKALEHRFFWTDPMPCDLKRLMSTLKQSMFDYTAPAQGSTTKRVHPTSTSNQPATSSSTTAKVPALTGHLHDRVF